MQVNLFVRMFKPIAMNIALRMIKNVLIVGSINSI